MNPLIAVRALAAIAAVVALFGAGWHFGSKNVQADWNTEKLATAIANQEAILKAVADNEAAYQTDIKQSAKVIANYETTIDTKNVQITAARADAGTRGLRINRDSVCNQLAATIETAGSVRTDAEREAATVELPQEITRSILDTGELADREIARKDAKIEALQQWAIDHGFAEGR